MNLQMLKMALIAYVNSAKAIWSVIAHPLSIISKKATMLKSYRIYGNSVQDGEPTPDNPIEVQSVGGLTTKNLFDKDNILVVKTANAKNAVPTNTGVKATITSDWGYVFVKIGLASDYAGKTLCFSWKPDSYNPTGSTRLVVVDSSSKILATSSEEPRLEDGTKYSIMTIDGEYTTEILYARLYFANIDITKYDTIEFQNIMVCESSEYVPYEPYHKYKVPVTVRGKNLFKYLTGQGANITLIEALESGDIVAGNPSADDRVNSYVSGWYRPGVSESGGICPVLHTGDVVTVSADITLIELRRGTEYKPSIHIYTREANNGHTSNGTTLINVGETVRISRTYTISEKYDGCTFYPVIPVNGNVVKIENLQFAYETDSQYEPYIEPQTYNMYLDEPLRKIGDYADVVDFEKGVVVRNITETNLIKDGYTISSQNFKTRTNTSRSLIVVNNKKPNGTNKSLLLCNRGQGTPDFYWNTDKVGICELMNPSQSSIIFSLPIDEVAVQSDFDTWVSNNDTTLVYLSNTPTEEPISLPNLPQFKGTTVYEVQQDIPPSGIEVCYYE